MYCGGCQRDGATPIEALTGTEPDVSHLRKLNCISFVNIPIQFQVEKFTLQTRKRMMVGYMRQAYRVYLSETGRITIIKDVRMIWDTIERKDESSSDMEDPAKHLPPVEEDQLIPDPVREVSPIRPGQLEALIYFPKKRRSTPITQEPN